MAKLALECLFEPSVAAVELLVADGMCGKKRAADRNHGCRCECTGDGEDEVVGEHLAHGRCAGPKNIV